MCLQFQITIRLEVSHTRSLVHLPLLSFQMQEYPLACFNASPLYETFFHMAIGIFSNISCFFSTGILPFYVTRICNPFTAHWKRYLSYASTLMFGSRIYIIFLRFLTVYVPLYISFFTFSDCLCSILYISFSLFLTVCAVPYNKIFAFLDSRSVLPYT